MLKTILAAGFCLASLMGTANVGTPCGDASVMMTIGFTKTAQASK